MMEDVDGPTLRSVRESKGVPLRRVARNAKMSHGHLSKVERGEVGRPVTPAVLAAYEKATGVALATAKPGEHSGWRKGQLSDAQRASFSGRVASVSVGGALPDPLGKILDSRSRLPLPRTLDDSDADSLMDVADVLDRLDGPMPGLVARVLLRWLVDLIDLQDRPLSYESSSYEPKIVTSGKAHASLRMAAARFARRAGRTAVDTAHHESARTLLIVALYAAVSADAADLRAAVLADIAAQHHQLGHQRDCQEIARLGEADERISDTARKRLQEVKALAIDAQQRVAAAVQEALGEREPMTETPEATIENTQG